VAIVSVLTAGLSVLYITRTDGTVLSTIIGAIVFIATRRYYKSKYSVKENNKHELIL